MGTKCSSTQDFSFQVNRIRSWSYLVWRCIHCPQWGEPDRSLPLCKPGCLPPGCWRPEGLCARSSSSPRRPSLRRSEREATVLWTPHKQQSKRGRRTITTDLGGHVHQLREAEHLTHVPFQEVQQAACQRGQMLQLVRAQWSFFKVCFQKLPAGMGHFEDFKSGI